MLSGQDCGPAQRGTPDRSAVLEPRALLPFIGLVSPALIPDRPEVRRVFSRTYSNRGPSNLPSGGCPVGCPQLAFEYLAGVLARQRVHDLDDLRHLEFG